MQNLNRPEQTDQIESGCAVNGIKFIFSCLVKCQRNLTSKTAKIFGKHRLGLYFHYTMEKTGTS